MFEPASFAKAPRLIGNPAIESFFTYRKAYQIDAPARSAANPSLLVLTGASDGSPFRFELSVDSLGAVHLVRDPTAKVPPSTDTTAN